MYACTWPMHGEDAVTLPYTEQQKSLYPQQEIATKKFVERQDVFESLLAGSGNSTTGFFLLCLISCRGVTVLSWWL